MSDELAAIASVEEYLKVQPFVESDVYDVLKKGMAEDKRIASDALASINVWDYDSLPALQNAIAKLQEDVILSGKVSTYFATVIQRGLAGEEYLRSLEEET